MSENGVKTVIHLLEEIYRAPVWQPNHDPLSELIRTILSQNTSDANSMPAFHRLRSAFSTWEDVVEAGVDDIAAVIKSSGLGQIKSKRIKQSLSEIKRKQGRLSLDFLDELSVDEAREWLKQLPGVGDKTANCVLLFALGKAALPVDTHIFRVARRLGLIPSDATLSGAHEALGGMVSGKDVYAFHVLMIEHGRRTCNAQRSHCPECVLRRICPGYEKFMGHPATN